MTKKRVTKFILLALALLILPFSTNLSFTASADTYDGTTKALTGVEFTFDISDANLKKAEAKSVKITLKKGAEEPSTVYDGGSDIKDAYVVSYSQGSTDTNAKVKATVYTAGEYVFTVKATLSAVEYTHSELVTVVSDVNQFNAPTYKLDSTLLKAYSDKVIENTFIKDTNPQQNLRINDDYIVPSLEEIINSDLLAYSKYRRTVYYAAPTATTYATSSASGNADLSFKISKLGEYRFYVTLTADTIDGKKFDLTTANLEEKIDGWHKVYKSDGTTPLYASQVGTEYKYYTDEEHLTEYDPSTEGAVVTNLVIPVFTFEIINNAGPKITISSSYQENGYIDLEYKVKSITVGGSDIHTTYTLQYNANSGDKNDAGWVKAEEEYDSSKQSFTPTKQGYYRVYVYVIDGDGNEVEDKTSSIKVTEKYQNVEYKASFKDWVSANTLPFVFICISAVCLLSIVGILVAPKVAIIIKKDKKTEEKDL